MEVEYLYNTICLSCCFRMSFCRFMEMYSLENGNNRRSNAISARRSCDIDVGGYQKDENLPVDIKLFDDPIKLPFTLSV